MKSIYLIRNTGNGDYKIGTSKTPEGRRKHLQTGNSEKIEIVKTYISEFSYKIEKTLHRKYDYLRKEGEWFELSMDDVHDFIPNCEKIDNIIKFLKDSGNIFI